MVLFLYESKKRTTSNNTREASHMKKLGLLPRLILGIILGIVIGNLNLPSIVRILATFNSIFGNFLGFTIPLIIVGFIIPGIADLGKSAGKLLGVTTLIAYCSTVIAGCLAFFTNHALLSHIISLIWPAIWLTPKRGCSIRFLPLICRL